MHASISRFTVAFFILLFAKGMAFSQNVNYATTRLAAPTAINTGTTNAPVGTIEGALSVTPTGAATYTIPIKVAPGTAGMEPKLSLIYSSQGGNGILGQGWSLSGLSAISRSGKDYYHDGKVTPITWSNDDVFYLDGSRLTVINDTNNGRHNAIYTTEQEVGTQVLQQWQTSYPNGSPFWFRVHSKDGMVMHYGELGNSQVFSNNSNNSSEILSWKLNSIIDVNENRVDYSYNWIAGEHLLTSIKYTVNSNASLASYNEVKFIYKGRIDQTTSYVAGSGYASKSLLEKIEIWNYENGAVKVRSYEMEYVYEGVQSILQSLKESGTNNVSLNETQFVYGDADVRTQRSITPISGISQPISSEDWNVGRWNITGDFNGDGYTDIVEIKRTPRTGHYYLDGLEFKMNNVTNSNFTSTYTYPIGLGGTNGPLLGLAYNTSPEIRTDGTFPGAKAARNQNFQVGDFDGDGVDDILVAIRTGSDYNTLEKIVILTNLKNIMNPGGAPTITPYFPPNGKDYISDDWTDVDESKSFIYVGDFDGDGISDFLTMLKDRNSANNNNISGWQITCPGKPNSSPYRFANVSTSGITFPNNHGHPWPLGTVSKAKFSSTLNFDGGMNHEFIYANGNTTRVFGFSINSSGNWVANVMFDGGYPTQWHDINLGDFNGDGMTDLLTKTNNSPPKWEVGFSTGRGLVVKDAEMGALLPPSASPITISDINGDGKSDVTFFSQGGVNTTRYVYTIYDILIGANNFYSNGFISFNTTQNSTNFVKETTILGDFNGDGRIDFFSHNSNDIFYVSIGKDKQNNVLRQVRNGLGAVTEVNYLPLTTTAAGFYTYSGPGNFPLNNLKIPLWAVVEVKSGLQSYAPRNSMFYSYEDLKILKDGRGMVGFKKRGSYDAVTGNYQNHLLQQLDPNYYIPKTVSVETGTWNGGQQYINTSSDYRTITPIGLPTSLGFPRRYKMLTTESTSTDWLSNVTTNVKTVYDGNDNPEIITTSIPSVQTSIKTITYAPATTTKTPIPSKPETVTSTNTRNGKPSVTTTTAYDYINGNLRTQIDYYNLSNPITTLYTYNNTLGKVDEKQVSSYSGTRSESYGYDPKFRFAKSLTNNLGQTTSTIYDSRWGVPLSKTEFNGVTTTYEYDEFGRIFKTNMPEGYSITRSLTWNPDVYDNEIPNRSCYKEQIEDPSTGTSYTTYNVQGQPLQSGAAIWETNGTDKYAVSNILYDAVGRKKSNTVPHYSTDQASSYLKNEFSYNNLGRVFNVSNANKNDRYAYTYSGQNLKTEVTDNSARKNYTLTDPTGKTIESGDQTGELSFDYDSWGNVIKTTSSYIPISTATYDDYNRNRSMKETSSGTTTYEYNGFGEIVTQTDASSNVTTTGYDPSGRLEVVTFPEGSIYYDYYNIAGQGAGAQLKSEIKYDAGGAVEQKREYSYDWLGRVEVATYTQLPNLQRSTTYAYDNYSRLRNMTYSSGVEVINDYKKGALYQVTVDGSLVYEITNVNGLGQPTTIWRGSGVVTTNTYNLGNLIRRQTPLVPGQPAIQDYRLEYNWQKGLITRRRDDVHNIYEDFEYDAADRLKRSQLGSFGPFIPTPAQTQIYGSGYSSGNILTKSDVGQMSYKGHAVAFTPNTAGTLPQNQQDVAYSSYHRPLHILENGYEANFNYGTDNERTFYELKHNGAFECQKSFLPDGVEIVDDALGNHTEVTYVPGADGVAAIVANGSIVGYQVFYPYTDHLGSITTLAAVYSGVAGMTLNKAWEQAFDPWGRRRNVNTWAADDNAVPPAHLSWLRGFTGHEHLDEFGLINMNARLYDPKLGRMLSVDNFVSVPESAMGYNRYTYANNNPLLYTDPTGNLFVLDDLVLGAIGGVINLATNLGSVHSFAQGVGFFGIGFAGGALSTYISPVGSAALVGAGNAALGGYIQNGSVDAGAVLSTAFNSAVISVATLGIGNAISPYLGNLLPGIASPVVQGAITGAIVGGGLGGIGGGLSSLISGGGFWQGVGEGAAWGAGIGAFTGAITGFGAAKTLERDPWTGKPLYSDIPTLESIPPRSLGAARSEYKSMLKDLELYTKEQIAEYAKNNGFIELPNGGAPTRSFARPNKFSDGFRRDGLRLRLDPPDANTNYHHLHINRIDDGYNIKFEIKGRKTPDVHLRHKQR